MGYSALSVPLVHCRPCGPAESALHKMDTDKIVCGRGIG